MCVTEYIMDSIVNTVIKKLHTKHFVDWHKYSFSSLDGLHSSEQCIVYLGPLAFLITNRKKDGNLKELFSSQDLADQKGRNFGCFPDQVGF